MEVHLGIEYRQWQFSKQLQRDFHELITANGPENSCCQNVKNTFERWILSLQQITGQLDRYLPLFRIGTADSEANERIMKELSEIHSIQSDSTQFILRQLLDKIEEFRGHCHSEKNPEIPKYSEVKDELENSHLEIGSFQSVPSSRIRVLVQRFGLLPTACMVLRYEAMGNGGYQWGDPKSVHRFFYLEFGCRYEGFASPLNSRFLGQEGAHFCSVFPDTDTVFGSLGSFFEIDLMKHQGGWTANPPYIESVLQKTAQRVVNVLQQGARSYFLLNYPCWKDCDGWKILNDSKFKIVRYDVHGGHFLVQNAYGNSFRPNMKMSHFVLGHLPVNCPDVSTIKTIIYRQ